MVSSGKPWMTNPKNEHYKAAADATEYVYNVRPDLTREGGSIPITLVFQVNSIKILVHRYLKWNIFLI